MYQKKHAEQMAARFRELLEQSGDSLSDQHYEELALIIESGLDVAVIEQMERVAFKLEKIAHEIKHNVESDI